MIRFELYYLLVTIVFKILVGLSYRFKRFLRWFESKATLIHELMHYAMMRILCMRVPIRNLRVLKNGSGYVKIPASTKRPFVKMFLVAFAPLIGGTIFLLELGSWWPKGGMGFFGTTLKFGVYLIVILAVSPSMGDYNAIWGSIVDYPRIFIRQLLFFFLAFGIYIAIFQKISPYAEIFAYLFEFLAIGVIFLKIELICWTSKKLYDGLVKRGKETKKFCETLKEYGQKANRYRKKKYLVESFDLEEENIEGGFRTLKKSIKKPTGKPKLAAIEHDTLNNEEEIQRAHTEYLADFAEGLSRG